jgi:WD40 repeat protein
LFVHWILAFSGIHVWDLRYVVSGGPARTFEVPSSRESSGITSLCWDRFQSSFFASCTDNAIHEYMPSVQSEKPIRTLNGKDINSFFVQCNASPVSDHLICGSSSKKTYIWDLQVLSHYILIKKSK